ncbi:aquaporin [Candidatus Saccharibacteria bacterium]|nr:aquaporin [Candidatus Saccharibacteria bacterium]
MATKKPKTSTKTTTKSKTTKPKTAAKTAEKTVIEAPKTNTVEKNEKKNFLSGFFAKKYEGTESIMTIFKERKFYGALLGEVIGTMLLALLIFSISMMNIANIAAYAFAIVAIFVAVVMFSGASLNPLVTVGLMATRRVSVIRGIMYIIAEIVGAWLGWMIFNAFHLAGGETAYDVPAMAAVAEGNFWIVTMVEFLGSTIFAFFVARALDYKRSVFTFAAVIAGGLILAIIIGYVVSAAFVGLSSNFAYNPALALMFQIFPTAGENFGEILGGICQALAIYAIFPCIGGVLGFYLSDFMKKLSED